MQQLHHLGCGWTDDGWMFLTQGTDLLINSIDTVVDKMNLKTISNIQIPTYIIATIATKVTGKCIAITPCILEVISIQSPQLVMKPMIHLKDEIEPAQVLLTLINLVDDVIQITKYTMIGNLSLHANDQELQDFKICHLSVE